MRSLFKGDSGLACPEPPSVEELGRTRRRHLFRRVIALVCIGTVAFFACQFLRGEFAASTSIARPVWTDPADVASWLRGRVLAATWQLREAVGVALPSGNFGLIMKVCGCAVVAAVFLRLPRRA